MDPIAHTLFGAAMAEAGLKRKTALATATLVIGANIPDVDALAIFFGSDTALYLRRGWTHGILALLIWPFLLAGGMMLFDRLISVWRSRRHSPIKEYRPIRSGPTMTPKWLLILSFLSVWSHPLLDWLNTYGIRLLMPFSGDWFYGDSLFIIDPWLWLLTGAAVVLARSNSWLGISGWILLGAALSGLVLSTSMVPFSAKIIWSVGMITIVLIRYSNRFKEGTQPMALTLLLTAILYATMMFTGSQMTVWQVKRQLAEQDIHITEAMSSPPPARPLIRNGVAVSGTHYYLFRLNWIMPGSFELRGEPVPRTEPEPLVEIALNAPELRGFRNWMRYPAYEVRKLESGWRVYIRDLRYTDPNEDTVSGIGMAVVDLDQNQRIRSVQGP